MTRCIRCNRPLFAPVTVTVTTKGGTRSYGPVCARKAGLIESKHRTRVIQHAQQERDPAQLDWLEAIAA